MGVFRKDQITSLRKIIDDEIKAGPLEFIDGPLAEAGIKKIDGIIEAKVPEHLHDDIRQLADKVILKDVPGVIDESADLLSEIGKSFLLTVADR